MSENDVWASSALRRGRFGKAGLQACDNPKHVLTGMGVLLSPPNLFMPGRVLVLRAVSYAAQRGFDSRSRYFFSEGAAKWLATGLENQGGHCVPGVRFLHPLPERNCNRTSVPDLFAKQWDRRSVDWSASLHSSANFPGVRRSGRVGSVCKTGAFGLSRCESFHTHQIFRV